MYKIGYGVFYCVIENQPPQPNHSFYLSFFSFSPINFCHKFLSSFESQSLYILYTPTEGLKYVMKKNQGC